VYASLETELGLLHTLFLWEVAGENIFREMQALGTTFTYSSMQEAVPNELLSTVRVFGEGCMPKGDVQATYLKATCGNHLRQYHLAQEDVRCHPV